MINNILAKTIYSSYASTTIQLSRSVKKKKKHCSFTECRSCYFPLSRTHHITFEFLSKSQPANYDTSYGSVLALRFAPHQYINYISANICPLSLHFSIQSRRQIDSTPHTLCPLFVLCVLLFRTFFCVPKTETPLIAAAAAAAFACSAFAVSPNCFLFHFLELAIDRENRFIVSDCGECVVRNVFQNHSLTECTYFQCSLVSPVTPRPIKCPDLRAGARKCTQNRTVRTTGRIQLLIFDIFKSTEGTYGKCDEWKKHRG